MIKKVKKYQIYIGMKDKEKMEQLCPSGDFIKMVSELCKNYKIEFTMEEVYGGYITSNKDFLCENSLVLSIIGLSKSEILKLAGDLKNKFNQESVMISEEEVKTYILN